MARYVTAVSCLKIDKKTRRNKALMFTLSVTWSDGTCDLDSPIQRQYVALFDFHAKLKEKYKDESKIHFPELPAAKKFNRSFLRGAKEKKKKALVEDYFEKIVQLPPHISRGETVREFFEFDSSPGNSEIPVEAAVCSITLTNDLGEYESIDDYASVNDTAAADCVMPMTSDNDVIDTVYLAVHSYTKRKSGEVNLQQGSTVDVLQTELSGWWFVHVQETGEQGWAPASCLLPENREELVEVAVTGPLGEFQTRCDYDTIEPDELSFTKDQKVEVLEARLDGWWKVKCCDKVGLTPATHLKPVVSDKTASNTESVYHHVGIYRKLSPPPRRDPNESIDELYAQVNKTKGTPSVSAAPVSAATDAECMYSQIDLPTQLSPEDYKSSDEALCSNVSRHSYVNSPHSARSDHEPQSDEHQLELQPTKPRTEQPPLPTNSSDLSPAVHRSPLNKTFSQQTYREQLYVQKMDRSQCERLLSERGQTQQYIIRQSTKARCPYALSVLSSERVYHIPIELTVDNKFYIGQYSFDSVARVIAYYSRSPLCYTSDGGEVVLGSQFPYNDAGTSFLPSQ